MNPPHDLNVTTETPANPAATPDAGRAATFAAPAGPLATTDHVPGPASTSAPASGLPSVPGYGVLREIARGGMGKVLAAFDLTLDRDVALKVLLPGADADRFVRESKITARLPHPGIPPVHALGTLADGSPFLAMKLIAGQTLAEEMKTADRPRLLQAFAQVCQAVGFAHSRGVIHRDLKPDNVMVGAFGEVQVMDWGLAKDLTSREVVDRPRASATLTEPAIGTDADQTTDHRAPGETTDERTQAGAVLGTPAYMAPEQARAEAVDARADVFALGGILCAILTGKAPFGGTTVMEVIQHAGAADLAEANARLDGCGADAELVALCRRCLSPSPADRPANGAELAELMAAYRAGVERRLRAAELARASTEAKAAEQRKRRRLWLGSAAVLALAVVGGLTAVVAVQRNANQRLEEANQQITKQRDEAERQRGLATAAKTQAEQNEQVAQQQAMLALTSMQLIVTDIDSKLAAQPGTANLRIGLLQTLEKKWDELDLAMAGGVSGEAMPTLTAVRFRIADAWVSLDRIAEAHAQYQKLFDQAEPRLLVKNRNDSSRFNLAYICRRWAPIKSRVTGNPADAAVLRARAVDLLREIRSDPRPEAKSPPRHFIADVLQGVLLESAGAFVSAGDRAKAEAAYTEVGQLCEAVLDEANAQAEWFTKLKPEDQRAVKNIFAQNLELSRAGRANNLCALGKADAAVAIFRGIIERSRVAQANAPQDPNARHQLAIQLGNYGQQMQRVGRTADAAKLLAESLELIEKIFNADPTNARLKRSYGHTLYYLGVAQDAQGHAADARALFQRSLAIREEMHTVSPDTANKVNLMLVQSRVGNVDAARALADQLSASKNKDPDLRLDVARALAQLVPQTKGATQESFRNAAFAALDRSLEDGQVDQFTIASQPDLAPIKDDARFRAILARLAPTEGAKQRP